MKTTQNRRQFIQILPLGAAIAAGAFASASHAAATAMVNNQSPQATGLGYVSDAAKVDKTKYKQFVAGSACGNCAIFQGKAGDAGGACPLFAGQGNVSAKGWCSAYAKKPA